MTPVTKIECPQELTKMKSKSLENQDNVSATGQFHWDTYTLWQQRVRCESIEAKEKAETESGWDPYEVWKNRVR